MKKMFKIIASIIFVLTYLQCYAEILGTDEYYMRIALNLAKSNPKAPFAAIIVDNMTGKILAQGVNASKTNPTFHGEMVTINNCIKKHPKMDLSKVTLYTTAEPCAMCQGAVIWAKISRVVFATPLKYLIHHGWDQININASEINKKSPFYRGTVTGNILDNETNPLFNKDIS